MSERSPPDSSDSFLTFLPGRLGLDLDAGLEQVLGIGQLQAAGAAGEQRLEELLEVGGDVGEGGREDADDLAVDGLDDLGQLASRFLDVVELLLQELVALL